MAEKPKHFLDEILDTSKKALKYVLIFSFGANLMMLALPIYTLQILERVPASGSIETLMMLTIVALGMIAAYGLFQLARSLTLVKLARWMDEEVATKLLKTSLVQANLVKNANASQALRDMNTIKQFLTGPGLSALFDAPWSIIFFLVLFLIHPVPFFITLIGGFLLLFAGILNERATNKTLGEANDQSIRSMQQVDVSARNAEVIEAMGMTDAVVSKWQKENAQVVDYQSQASDRSAVITNLAKAFRMILQIAVMGSGIYLVLLNELSLGGVIACSILAARALSPFEQAIAAWNNVAGFRKALARLRKLIEAIPLRDKSISLPAPQGHLSVEKVVFAPFGSQKPVLKGIGFDIKAGESLGVIGPSAAGKSTLAKLLVGVWKPNAGHVRLDGADVYSWNREEFGRYVGYMPQDVELFGGTVKENIARMQENAKDEDIIAAAKMSGAHEMILHLPEGYETQIGVGGANLSAGQRQRIGLARAFYGDPKVIVLDEPNSNLDDAGEMALAHAMKNAKSLKITTVIIAHRPSILGSVDKILVMKEGTVADFGPAKEIMAKYSRNKVTEQQKKQLQAAEAKGKKPAATNPTSAQFSLSGKVDNAEKPTKGDAAKAESDPKTDSSSKAKRTGS